MSQYIINSIFTFIPYYLGFGFIISIIYSAMVSAMRDEEAELNVGEIALTIFLYPFIIYQIIKTYRDGE
jgi:hypothetical protein